MLKRLTPMMWMQLLLGVALTVWGGSQLLRGFSGRKTAKVQPHKKAPLPRPTVDDPDSLPGNEEDDTTGRFPVRTIVRNDYAVEDDGSAPPANQALSELQASAFNKNFQAPQLAA